MRRGLKARTGINLMATSTYGMKGAEKAKTTISNVAKDRCVAPSAFAGEFVAVDHITQYQESLQTIHYF